MELIVNINDGLNEIGVFIGYWLSDVFFVVFRIGALGLDITQAMAHHSSDVQMVHNDYTHFSSWLEQ